MKFNSRKFKDRLFTVISILALIITILPLAHIIYTVLINGIQAINIEFLTQLPEPPVVRGGGIVNAIEGTVVLISLALLISFPLGLLTGIYLSEYGKGKHVDIIRDLVNTLSGMPSIVAGLLAYTLLVINYGFSAVSGAFALSLLAIPYIVRSSEEALKMVPREIREAGLALGLPKWKVTLYLVLGAAKPRIVAGTLLAVARIIGEAAPLLFTAFGSSSHVTSIFEPVSALPLLIFVYAVSPFKSWHTKAWGAALLLMLIVLIINFSVKYYMKKTGY
ncbi:MAG: phosphate ABC transporter permease PstA [Candidatus Njordarchaeia archaeon]